MSKNPDIEICEKIEKAQKMADETSLNLIPCNDGWMIEFPGPPAIRRGSKSLDGVLHDLRLCRMMFDHCQKKDQ